MSNRISTLYVPDCTFREADCPGRKRVHRRDRLRTTSEDRAEIDRVVLVLDHDRRRSRGRRRRLGRLHLDGGRLELAAVDTATGTGGPSTIARQTRTGRTRRRTMFLE